MQRIKSYILLLPLAAVLFSGCVAVRPSVGNAESYVVEQQAGTTLRVLFDKKYPTSQEQWEYALKTRNKGQLKKADRRMLYLVRHWRNSPEAPLAQRARADMLYSREKLKDAFDAYQHLINNYSSRMEDYEGALQSQFEIAVKLMNHRRMRWVFGGYRAPEYSVEYFEKVIRNGPHWSRSTEAQFLIGQAYEESGDLEEAIIAYSVLGYRYPDSRFAEEAAWRQLECLERLQQEYSRSPEILNRLLTASTVFISSYPESPHRKEVVDLRNRLYEVKARQLFDIAEFYTKGPHPRPLKAALAYYQKLVLEFPQSELVPRAQKRIQELEAKGLEKSETR